MNKRPLLLKLFAFILLCEPLIRIVLMSLEKEFPLSTILSRSLSLGLKDSIHFWLLFPISGFLILSVKPVAFIAYIMIQLYSLYFHITYESFSWPYLSNVPTASALFLLGLNICFIIYFLLPRNREPFFNKGLRWWERGSRYVVDQSCIIVINDQEVMATLSNISFSGALIAIKQEINEGDHFKIEFDILGEEYQFNSVVKRKLKNNMYGLIFNFDNYFQKIMFRLKIYSIDKNALLEKYR